MYAVDNGLLFQNSSVTVPQIVCTGTVIIGYLMTFDVGLPEIHLYDKISY